MRCDRFPRSATILRSTVPALAALTAALLSGHASAQPVPVNGVRPADVRVHAIVDATVTTAPGRTIENATIVIRDGVIEAVGVDVPIPPAARRWSGEGRHVYAGLIDAAVLVDAGDLPASPGRHWNPQIHPELALSERPALDDATRKSLRELGFTAAAAYPSKGIVRGSGAVFALAADDKHVLTYRDRALMAAGFDRGRPYPGSQMGSIALFRQTMNDARWHAECRRVWERSPNGNEPPAPADALVALDDVLAGRQAILFDVSDEHDAMRAARLAREFDLDMWLLGSGYEFRRLESIVALSMPILLPVDYPKRPELTSIATTDSVSLADMMTWEQAPTNARRLVEAGATVAFTTHRLKKRGDFAANVRSAIKHGLAPDAALAAVTTVPARLLGLDDVMGTIEPGKVANLLVLEGMLFEKDAKVRDVWINGRRSEISEETPDLLVSGGVLKTADGLERRVRIDTKKKSVTVHVPVEGDEDAEAETKKIKAKKVVVQRDQLSFVIDGVAFGEEGYVQLSGALTAGVVTGTGMMPDGRRFGFTITPTEDEEGEEAGPDEGEEIVAGGSGESPDASASPDADADADAADAAADPDDADDGISGEWALTVTVPGMDQEFPISMLLAVDPGGAVTGEMSMMEQSAPLEDGSFDPASGRLSFSVTGPAGPSAFTGTVRDSALTGSFNSEMGEISAAGSRIAGDAIAAKKDDDGDDEEFVMPPDELVFPLGAYGVAAPPSARTVVVRNATIWTCGPDGILENADLLVRDGRVAAIGDVGPVTGDHVEVDGAGKHVTPGLLDCHSHTGISRGVNEGGQTNTAEVRIGDVVNPDDINWYRQLAGGLTIANQLHGSANPIGGQNSVVKIRWGGTAEDFRIPDAIPGIKFALGENVKRSQTRYPNTRMGVETFIIDAFTAAREYEAEWDRYLALPSERRERTMPPRRDLELETLVEILGGERIVHCHSYRQDEILMLIRVAETFGFTIGTFQHVLEGYKVAEAIAAHGAGASSFSDWWAYKVEVMDAIPFNGALMTDVGVLVSFNSDSSELARRMNTEASKAVRYGGIAPAEALKLVTLNPAKQLRIDHRVGSLENGKDGDFVVWSDSPLSTYARCEQTWIEGARYFDLESDAAMREQAQAERQRLIQKILGQTHGMLAKSDDAAPADAAPDSRPAEPAYRIDAGRLAWMEEQVRLGRDPNEIRPGECACLDDGLHLHESGGHER